MTTVTLGIDKLFNPRLYTSLKQTFGRVKVTNIGQPMDFTISRDATKRSTDRYSKIIIIHSWGEAYRVCCPKCNDRRFRLFVNHRHRTIDADSKVPFGNKVRCFNEECDHSDFDDRYLKPYMRRGQPVLTKGSMSSEEMMLGPAPLPGLCAKLTSLSNDGAVLTYLRNRKGGGFSPDILEQDYGVCYCYHADEEFPIMTNRLLIPVYYSNILVGWQGRAIDDDTRPKYFTMPGFPKGRVLYNYDRARHKPFVIVCEGVFDAMRIGDCAVSVLGSTITDIQKRMLYYTWKSGAMLIMFDPDDPKAQEKAQETVEECHKSDMFLGGVGNIVLPPGTDPADIPHRELWKEIYTQCKQQRIRLI